MTIPQAPPESSNGDITTACDYDPYTGNNRRSVVDIVVAGAAGTQPLALIRTASSRGVGQKLAGFGLPGAWSHNYQWVGLTSSSSTTHNFAPSSYSVYFPDGRAETFWYSASDIYFRAGTGVRERYIPMNPAAGNMLSYLVLADDSKVQFTATQQAVGSSPIYYYYTYVATAMIDPYGQVTTVTYNSYGLRVTEPGGRALQFVNGTTTWGDQVIDHVASTDGRTVQYHYSHSAMPGASQPYTYLDSVTYYGDTTGNLVAHYTYQKPNIPDGSGAYNGIPLLSTCIDPMYAGPMWKIAYVYSTALNEDNSAPVYGQIRSENYFDGTTVQGAVSTLRVNNAMNTRAENRGDVINGAAPSRAFYYGGTYGSITYPSNLLTKCNDFKGVSATQGYDANNFVNSITDRNNHITTCTRNAITGNLTQVKFPVTSDAPGQGTISYTYSDPNNPYYLSSATDEAGHITYFDRDGKNRVWRIRYPDGSYETFAYNGFGQVVSHLLTTGGTETFTYDASGLKTQYRDPYHASGNPTTRYLYDGLSRLIQTTDALGTSTSDPTHSTSYTYNSRGQLWVTTLPTDPNDHTRHTITNAYNPNGTPASVTDELGHVTSYIYDDYKRATQQKTPVRFAGDSMSHTTVFNYTRWNTTGPYLHTFNFPFAVTSPNITKIYNYCDNNFRKTSVEQAPGVSGDDATTSFSYDNVGNMTTVTDPVTHVSTTTYDKRNRPMSVKDALNHTTSFSYDARGHKASITRPNGQVVTYVSYDSMNRLLQQKLTQDPNPAAVTKYTYDPTGGMLQTMTDPNGNVYSYAYDLLNRKSWLIYPANSQGVQTSENWIYNTTGNGTLYQFKNRIGNVETFTYDNLNRVTLAHWNDGLTPDVSLNYDAASRVINITNSNSAITRGYYNDNLLNNETSTYGDGIARTVTYGFDPDGRRDALSSIRTTPTASTTPTPVAASSTPSILEAIPWPITATM